MTDSSGFAKLVPGFDFLQGLAKNAGAAIPGMGQWVAPTLDPAELEKRIEELRTVQFWLEQNARLLGTTIQALEVQRMTLSTLKTMNVQMEGLRDSLKVPMPGVDGDATAAPAAPGAVDPMQWWNALTQQFTEIATNAIKDTEKAAESVRQTTASPTPAKKAPRKAASGKKTTSMKQAVRRKPY